MYYVLSVVTLDTSIKHVSVKNNRFKPQKKKNKKKQPPATCICCFNVLDLESEMLLVTTFLIHTAYLQNFKFCVNFRKRLQGAD